MSYKSRGHHRGKGKYHSNPASADDANNYDSSMTSKHLDDSTANMPVPTLPGSNGGNSNTNSAAMEEEVKRLKAALDQAKHELLLAKEDLDHERKSWQANAAAVSERLRGEEELKEQALKRLANSEQRVREAEEKLARPLLVAFDLYRSHAVSFIHATRATLESHPLSSLLIQYSDYGQKLLVSSASAITERDEVASLLTRADEWKDKLLENPDVASSVDACERIVLSEEGAGMPMIRRTVALATALYSLLWALLWEFYYLISPRSRPVSVSGTYYSDQTRSQ
ncbi:hypothetical protein DIPPA_31514 [Diplonema papillatum]|nr:hypothetical protein DIPPA_31514 [Diplonema papillatum]